MRANPDPFYRAGWPICLNKRRSANFVPLPFSRGTVLSWPSGQTHAQAYTRPLLDRIEAGEIDPSFVVTHPASLEDAPEMYRKFRDKEDGVIKVVLHPG